jgi:HTH-type transcriptional regulator/antitoxin HigA
MAEASFILRIENRKQHEQALALMEELIENYTTHTSLIDLLSISIEKYEHSGSEFASFNQRLAELKSGVAALAVLMEQHHLNTSDFENEIGGKSLVSMILNGKRALNLNHIRKLSKRLSMPPQLFI